MSAVIIPFPSTPEARLAARGFPMPWIPTSELEEIIDSRQINCPDETRLEAEMAIRTILANSKLRK